MPDAAELPAATAVSLVVLGAGGDLTTRLLLPGLARLLAADRHDLTVQLVGAGPEQRSDDDWRDAVRRAFGDAPGEAAQATIRGATWVTADATSADDLARVLGAADHRPVLYFALPPAITVRSVDALAAIELPDDLVLALEKPFGTDLASARALNARLASLVPEERIHRVDHFLGKSRVVNLLGVRFANRFVERVWNRDDVARIEVVCDEQLTLENRAGYYDRNGALRDMLQSHLMLVAALVAMDPPSSVAAADLRDGMAIALRAMHPIRGRARRARYTAGRIGDRDVPAYVDEPGVDPSRGTETLAELELAVGTWRFAGVPFVLRSGKAVGSPRKEIAVHFREVPRMPAGLTGDDRPSVLVLPLDTGDVSLDLVVNGEGTPTSLERVRLRAAVASGELEAYGEVIAGIVTGEPLLSVRADMAEECWRIVESVLAEWEAGDVPLDEYAAGSDGPAGWVANERD